MMHYLKQAKAKSYMDLGCGDGVIATKLAEEMPGVEVMGLSMQRCEIDAATERASKLTMAEGSSVSFK